MIKSPKIILSDENRSQHFISNSPLNYTLCGCHYGPWLGARSLSDTSIHIIITSGVPQGRLVHLSYFISFHFFLSFFPSNFHQRFRDLWRTYHSNVNRHSTPTIRNLQTKRAARSMTINRIRAVTLYIYFYIIFFACGLVYGHFTNAHRRSNYIERYLCTLYILHKFRFIQHIERVFEIL